MIRGLGPSPTVWNHQIGLVSSPVLDLCLWLGSSTPGTPSAAIAGATVELSRRSTECKAFHLSKTLRTSATSTLKAQPRLS